MIVCNAAPVGQREPVDDPSDSPQLRVETAWEYTNRYAGCDPRHGALPTELHATTCRRGWTRTSDRRIVVDHTGGASRQRAVWDCSVGSIKPTY